MDGVLETARQKVAYATFRRTPDEITKVAPAERNESTVF